MRKMIIYVESIDKKERLNLMLFKEIDEDKYEIEVFLDEIKRNKTFSYLEYFCKTINVEKLFYEVLPNDITLNKYLKKELDEYFNYKEYNKFDILYNIGTCSNDIGLEREIIN